MSRFTGAAPSWMVAARSLIGIKEIRGAQHTPEILEMFRIAGHSGVKDDETPWCAAAANTALKIAGWKGTDKLNARSFLELGEKVEDPRIGDVVVLWRGTPNGWQGHVGFFAGFDPKGNIIVLGGNQNDEFNFTSYPLERLLEYRRPTERLDTPVRSPLFNPIGLDESLALEGHGAKTVNQMSLGELFDHHKFPRQIRRRLVLDWLDEFDI